MQRDGFEVLAAGAREQRIRERSPDTRLPLVHVGVAALLSGRDEDHALARRAGREEQRVDLGAVGEPAGDRLSVDAAVCEREAAREPGRARRDRVPHELAHALDLIGVRDPLVGRVAHDVEPQRRMPDVRGEVHDGATPVDGGEVLGKGLELPCDARHQRGRVHVFHVLERSDDGVVVLGTRGRDREAAVARDDGRHAVVRRRPQRRVPEHLRVVVGVDVDEARRDRAARRVELARPA